MARTDDSAATRIANSAALGELVRRVRREAGLDQATAAGLAGVGVRFLGDIERGKPTVRLDLVLQVLDRLGLDVMVTRRTHNRRAP